VLIDLLKEQVKGYFYEEQLTKCPSPEYKEKFFEIEKVIKTKLINNKKWLFVKYLYYPNKFNQWIPESNLKD